MVFLKSIGQYDIYAASKEECAAGYKGIAFEYPCFCVFTKYETVLNFETSESNYATFEQAAEFCRIYS